MIEKHIYEVLVRGDETGLKGASLTELTHVPDVGFLLGQPMPLPASVEDPTWQALFERINTAALNQVSEMQTLVSTLSGDLESAQQTIAEQLALIQELQSPPPVP